MAIQGNFETIMDDIFCSAQAAKDGALQALGENLITRLYDEYNIRELFTVISPVQTGDAASALYYPAVYNAVKNTSATDCTIGSCNVTPEYQAKVWSIALAECRVSFCTRTLTPKFLAYWSKLRRVDPNSDEYTAVLQMIEDMLFDLINNTLLAKLWLSDTSFRTDPDVPDSEIDGIDGFFAQIVSENDNKATTVAVNSGEDVLNNLKAAHEQYSLSTFNKSLNDAVIYLNDRDAQLLANHLNELGENSPYDCTCISVDGIVKAGFFTKDNISFRGLRVIPQPFTKMMSDFEEYHWQETDQPDVLMYDSFFVITPKENLLVGTPNEDDLSFYKHFYDNKDRTHYFDIGYQYGALVATDNFIWGVTEVANPYA